MKIIPLWLRIFFLLVTGQWTPAHAERPKMQSEIRAIYAPSPRYPRAARVNEITGSGVYAMKIDDRGHVVAVYVVQSSGNRHLDDAAINAFKQWQFTPGIGRGITGIKIPFTWELGEGAGKWVF